MTKPATYKQISYIADLARELGKEDPEYFCNEFFGKDRSANMTKKITMQQASELIDALKQEINDR